MRSKVDSHSLFSVIYFWFRALERASHGDCSLYSELIVAWRTHKTSLGKFLLIFTNTTQNTLPVSVSELWLRASTSSSHCSTQQALARRNVINCPAGTEVGPWKGCWGFKSMCLSVLSSRVRFSLIAFFFPRKLLGPKLNLWIPSI